MVQEEEVVVNTSVEDIYSPVSSEPPATSSTCISLKTKMFFTSYPACDPSVSLKYAPHPCTALPIFKGGKSSTNPSMSYLLTFFKFLALNPSSIPPVMITVGLVRSCIEQLYLQYKTKSSNLL